MLNKLCWTMNDNYTAKWKNAQKFGSAVMNKYLWHSILHILQDKEISKYIQQSLIKTN